MMDVSNGKSGISADRKSHSALMLAARSRRKPTLGRWTAIRVLTHQRHWLCTAAIVLMPGLSPIKVLV